MRFNGKDIAVLAVAIDTKGMGISLGVKEIYGGYEGIYNYSGRENSIDDNYSTVSGFGELKEFSSRFSKIYLLFYSESQLEQFNLFAKKLIPALFGEGSHPFLLEDMISLFEIMSWLTDNFFYFMDGSSPRVHEELETQYKYFLKENLEVINVYSKAKAVGEIAESIFSLVYETKPFIADMTIPLFDSLHYVREQNRSLSASL